MNEHHSVISMVSGITSSFFHMFGNQTREAIPLERKLTCPPQKKGAISERKACLPVPLFFKGHPLVFGTFGHQICKEGAGRMTPTNLTFCLEKAQKIFSQMVNFMVMNPMGFESVENQQKVNKSKSTTP